MFLILQETFALCLKYLGVYILTGTHFNKCVIKNAQMKFYRMFNAIYFRSKLPNPELVSVQLFKSFCLLFVLCYMVLKQYVLPKVQLEDWTSAFCVLLQNL